MINEKLAKELKDAGFPSSGHLLDMDTGAFCTCCDADVTIDKFCPPTLSELIAACGKEYKGNNLILWNCRKHWHVGFYKYGSCIYVDDYPLENEEGSTPEEAVAKLWLALNKK